ncbi:MAG: protein translocase subunit SecD [Myxococcales bacterium]|nr:protein translocase subunit SecD [Myxococcales bacterium]
MDRGWYLRCSVVVLATVLAALALWPSLQQWLPAPKLVQEWFPGRISPGLDIRGGLRLSYDVEVDEYIRDRRDRDADNLLRDLGVLLGVYDKDAAPEVGREQLQKVHEQVEVKNVGDRSVRVTFKDPSKAARFDRDWLNDHGLSELRIKSSRDGVFVLAMRDDQLDKLRATAVQQAVKTVSQRIDKLGLREASVVGQASNIVVELPGADQKTFDRIRSIISRTAKLEFKIVDDDTNFAGDFRDKMPKGIEYQTETVAAGESKPQVTVGYFVARGEDARAHLQKFVDTLPVPEDHQLLLGPIGESSQSGAKEEAWRTYYVFKISNVTGEDVQDANVAFDSQQGNRPIVTMQFNQTGARRFGDLTGRNVHRRMAIVLDDVVSSAPNIQERIGGGRGQITLGSFLDYNQLLAEAKDLVVVLRAGALPAPLRPGNEQLIGPTLGKDSVAQGTEGALVGIGLVLLFMAIYYEVAGLVADVMVLLNLLFILAIMAAFEATLTLPGIAAIALTVGMAVDANVLITERIREELAGGKSPRSAVDQGFGRAFWSVFDSQLTTFIAGVVLFQYGTGPIKGFAVMLMIGIVTSLFTGVFCSKVMMDWLVRGLRVERLRVG